MIGVVPNHTKHKGFSWVSCNRKRREFSPSTRSDVKSPCITLDPSTHTAPCRLRGVGQKGCHASPRWKTTSMQKGNQIVPRIRTSDHSQIPTFRSQCLGPHKHHQTQSLHAKLQMSLRRKNHMTNQASSIHAQIDEWNRPQPHKT
jgi:hypothetical protein